MNEAYGQLTQKLRDAGWQQVAMALPNGCHLGFSLWARREDIVKALDQDEALLRVLHIESDYIDIASADACWLLYQRDLGQWTPLISRYDLNAATIPFLRALGLADINYLPRRQPDEWVDFETWEYDSSEDRRVLEAIREWGVRGNLSKVISAETAGIMLSIPPLGWRDHISSECVHCIDDDQSAWDLLVACARAMRGFEGSSSYWTPSRATAHVLSILTAWEARTR